ncbi:helix-turn-helix transcriptional regulator [Streptomyces sp. HSG2]|uniref:helix-turn-helix domain-containing protein n=1 Tax=Streptomyces sp. HSG2 TaxID=2797167 RepID=UPI0019086537|nr:helix-turn-helix transcriptional regulator [Streptomyces sp. HSG2]
MKEESGEKLPRPGGDPEEERKDFARRIKSLREQANMSQEACGELIGVHKSTICNYEHERSPRVPPYKYLTRLLEQARNRSNITPDVLHATHRAYEHLLRRLAESSHNAVHQRMWEEFCRTRQRDELVTEIETAHEELRHVMGERERYRQGLRDGEAPDPARERQQDERIRQLELRRQDLCARRDAVTARLDALDAAEPTPTPPADDTPPPVAGPRPASVGALPPGDTPTKIAGKRRNATTVVVAGAVVALALGAYLIHRVTEPAGTTAGENVPPDSTPTIVSAPSPTVVDDPSPTTEATPTETEETPDPRPEPSGTSGSALAVPEEEGYLVTWNADFSAPYGSFSLDRAGDPSSLGNEVRVQSNSGVDPYITPGDSDVALGIVPDDDPIPGPSACAEIAAKQQVFRDELATGNRYCVKAGDTIGHFEVVNVKRTGEMNIYLVRWQPS